MTDSEQLEVEVRESDARYRGLFQSIDEAFVVAEMIVDENGECEDFRCIEANSAFVKLSRIADPAGKTLRGVVPGIEQAWIDIYASVVRTGEAIRFQDRVKALDRWFDVFASRFGGPGSRRVAILFTDITARKRAEEALADSTMRLERQARIFDTTLSAIADFAYIFDRDGRFVYSNQALLDLLGITFAEIAGKNFFDLNYPEDLAARLQRQIQQVIDTKSILVDETPFTSATGVHGYYEYIFSPVIGVDGSVEVVAGSTRNITERKNMEKSLQAEDEYLRRARDDLEARVAERTRELQEANALLLKENVERKHAEAARLELLQRLVNAQEAERRRISRELHDSLGQHFTALTLGLKAVHAHEDSPAHLRDRLDRLLGTALALDAEIDRLSYELRPRALDDLGLNAALRRHVQAWAEESGIAVEAHGLAVDGERMPPTVETTVFRVAQEALTNIRKHSYAARVSMIMERRGDGLRLIIEDNGAGFDPEKELVSGETRRLGLKGMSERAALVGGTVEIESRPGHGTTIYLSIPLGRAAGERADA